MTRQLIPIDESDAHESRTQKETDSRTHRSSRRGPGEAFVRGNGRIEATEVDVATKFAGRVDSILVSEGDFVSAGQPLATMQIQSLEAQRDEARANHQQAVTAVSTAKAQVAVRESDRVAGLAVVAQRESELDAAQRRLKRSETLSSDGAASLQELDDDRARVRSAQAAAALGRRLQEVGSAIGLHVALRVTDGEQPVGRGIGPALEARDVLAVLQGTPEAPADLRERALRLAADILEMGGAAPAGGGLTLATQVLADGRAWATFQAICAEQGGLRSIPVATHRHTVASPSTGRVSRIDNRLLARAAKLAGAPTAAAAGIDVHARLGDQVELGRGAGAVRRLIWRWSIWMISG